MAGHNARPLHIKDHPLVMGEYESTCSCGRREVSHTVTVHWLENRRHCEPNPETDTWRELDCDVCAECLETLKRKNGYVTGWDEWDARDNLVVNLEPCDHCREPRGETHARHMPMTREEKAKNSQSVMLGPGLHHFVSNKQVLLCKSCADKFDAQKDGSV